MRTLSIIAVCLLIVTSAAWAGHKDKGSDNSSSNSSASSSSGDHSSRSNDNHSSSSSSATETRSSSSSSGVSHSDPKPEIRYNPTPAPSSQPEIRYNPPADSGRHNVYVNPAPTQSGQPEIRYNPGNPGGDSGRHNVTIGAPNSGSYQPPVTTPRDGSNVTTMPVRPRTYASGGYYLDRTQTGNNAPADSGRQFEPRPVTGNVGAPEPITKPHHPTATTHSIYTTYTPAADTNQVPGTTADRTRDGAPKHLPDNNQFSGYRPSDTNANTNVETAPTTKSRRDATLGDLRHGNTPGSTGNTGYRPSVSSRKPDLPGHSFTPGGQASHEYAPSTKSLRDIKLVQARLANAPKTWNTYQPVKFVRPSSYLPPRVRDGHYYYNEQWVHHPCNFGYWTWDYHPHFSHRSLYFYYGFFPFVEITRLVVQDYPTVVYVDTPIYSVYNVSYESNRYPGLDDALADIRSAWVSGRFDLIQNHVRSSCDIAVLLDGKYDYSVTAADYLAMTEDALSQMDTVSFVWDKVQARRDGSVTAFGEHTYVSGDSNHTVYISFTLKRIGGVYYITEVGSTETPWI